MPSVPARGARAVLFLCLACSVVVSSCRDAARDDDAPYLADSTRRMAGRLGQIMRDADTGLGRGFDPSGVEQFRRQLADEHSFRADATEAMVAAYRALLEGDNERAIQGFEAVRARGDDGAGLGAGERRVVGEMLGIAQLRLGEQENCILHHGTASCLFPIGPGGVHSNPRGSRGAIAELEVLLASDPDDLTSRWLLNLAYMTLGEHPEGVPERWRLAPELFAAEHEFPRLTDVAGGTPLALIGLAGGAALDDFDGDGDLDVVSSSCGPLDPLRFLRNEGDGTFVERTLQAGFSGLNGGINLCHADYDNDGDRDVLVLRGGWLFTRGLYPNSLLRNNGDGTFDDVTEEAGLLEFEPTHSAAFADFDNDGWLDLFVGNESSPLHKSSSRLYRNDGRGGFVDVSAEVGLEVQDFVKGVAWGDFDNDGRQDLYLSCLGRPNRLLHNTLQKKGVHFREVTAEAGVERPFDSFATWFFDYDNDGWLDLFAAGFSLGSGSARAATSLLLGLPVQSARARLYHNRGDGTFEDVSEPAGIDRLILTMGANYGDVDGDGFSDVYLGTGEPTFSALLPNRMLRNDAGRGFQDVTTAAGLGHLQKGHGIAFGDVDQDGDLDLYANMGGWYSGDAFQNALFVNPGTGARWLTLRLHGVQSNRDALGARVRARIDEGGAERNVHATVGTGGSFGSNSLQVELGLGAATRIVELEVHWPAGGVQRFTDVPLDGVLRLREGADELEPVPSRPFTMAGAR